jgi:hypothetical protein
MRRLIAMPVFRRQTEIAELELRIRRDLARYYAVTPAARVAFFLNNLISEARFKGRLVPAAEAKHAPKKDQTPD